MAALMTDEPIDLEHRRVLRSALQEASDLRESLLRSLGCVSTAELLVELHAASQVIADAHGLNPALVRDLLLEWEVHRPVHP